MVLSNNHPDKKALMEAAFSGESLYLSFGYREGVEMFPGKRYFITSITIHRLSNPTSPELSRITFSFSDRV